MIKTIEISGKTLDFKCSAATQFSYKRLFGKSLMDEFIKRTRLMKDLQKAQKRIELLQANNEQEALIDFLADDTTAQDLIGFMTEFIPQFAYITWLEGNHTQQEVFRGLTEEAFLNWISEFDPNDLLAKAGDFISLWQGTNTTYSNLKNQ